MDIANGQPALADIARLSTRIGSALMQAGATADVVHESVINSARGLGCDEAEVYAQHAALIVMTRRGKESYTHMGKVGEHGTNLRYTSALLKLVEKIEDGVLDLEGAQQELQALPTKTKHYPTWLVAIATGVACAGFGRLLGVDWSAFGPIFLGAAVGQWLRHTMLKRRLNFYLMVTLVAFAAALIAGLGSQLLHAEKWELATVASTLLLVPGMAMVNAQLDILRGKPSLAAARVVRIMFILLFLSLGLILAQRILWPT